RLALPPVKDSTWRAVADLILVRPMFRNLAIRVIHLIISPRIEQMPNEPRSRYFRNLAWFCFVLALSEALFAFLIFWAWCTIVWVAPVLPAIWLAVGALVLFFVAAITFAAAGIARERAKTAGSSADQNRRTMP